jgi:hypothetical protein
MADTKISALSAAAAAALANELAINEAGTSKKLTLQQALDGSDLLASAGALADANKLLVTQSAVAKSVALSTLKAFMVPTLITGNSGAVSANAAPSQTYQILTADNSDIPTTTVVTQLTATGMDVGWWLAEYFIHWQSDASTNGITFIVDHSGTATPFVADRIMPVGSTTALATIGRNRQTTGIANTGFLPSVWVGNADAAALGPSAGTSAADETYFERVVAMLLVTGTGSLLLRGNSAGAGVAVRVMKGTFARYTRLS